MALMDAQEYDPRPAQKRRRIITTAVLVIGVPLLVWYFFFYYWPEEHVVNKFFQAIEQKDYDTAYGVYQGDANWQQHPERYANYTVNQFKLDWGPQGEYGTITSHHVDCSIEPPKKNFVSPSGVIVVVTINGRKEPRSMWVEKKKKTLTDSYIKAECRGQQ